MMNRCYCIDIYLAMDDQELKNIFNSQYTNGKYNSIIRYKFVNALKKQDFDVVKYIFTKYKNENCDFLYSPCYYDVLLAYDIQIIKKYYRQFKIHKFTKKNYNFKHEDYLLYYASDIGRNDIVEFLLQYTGKNIVNGKIPSKIFLRCFQNYCDKDDLNMFIKMFARDIKMDDEDNFIRILLKSGSHKIFKYANENIFAKAPLDRFKRLSGWSIMKCNIEIVKYLDECYNNFSEELFQHFDYSFFQISDDTIDYLIQKYYFNFTSDYRLNSCIIDRLHKIENIIKIYDDHKHDPSQMNIFIRSCFNRGKYDIIDYIFKNSDNVIVANFIDANIDEIITIIIDDSQNNIIQTIIDNYKNSILRCNGTLISEWINKLCVKKNINIIKQILVLVPIQTHKILLKRECISILVRSDENFCIDVLENYDTIFSVENNKYFIFKVACCNGKKLIVKKLLKITNMTINPFWCRQDKNNRLFSIYLNKNVNKVLQKYMTKSVFFVGKDYVCINYVALENHYEITFDKENLTGKIFDDYYVISTQCDNTNLNNYYDDFKMIMTSKSAKK